MDNETDFEFSEINVTVNGSKIEADNLWELLGGFEAALKDAGAIEYDDSIEVLSREARAVVSKCGY